MRHEVALSTTGNAPAPGKLSSGSGAFVVRFGTLYLGAQATPDVIQYARLDRAMRFESIDAAIAWLFSYDDAKTRCARPVFEIVSEP